MNTYYTTAFKGVNPVGVAAVCTESNADRAAFMLNRELILRGLKPTLTADQMVLVTRAHIINDGDY